jgi:uncharacterized membrane protein (UPF0136 family)
MMRVFALICCVATLLAALPTQVSGFAPVGLLCNTTKNRLMMPLRLDHALGLSKGNADNASPRGIALNTGVGGLVFAGGVMGFVKSGSKASLMAGSTFGGFLMLSAFLISKKNTKGNVLGSGVAGLLTYVMGKKFLRSGKFMPAGLIACMGAMSFVYNLIEAIRTAGKEKEGDVSESD